ncbi:HD-GYP domain-containing protein [Alteromonas sp. 14N.309.X.WAT.G.H12]|uniref:HD-GYP domain-containing protein n=1 Tax=Alteromonas sp. 14N.309.X.WAT.G.H12 TaxID=3120824 RepID=UPI002FD3DD85
MLKNLSIDEVVPGMFVNQVTEQSRQLRVRSSGLVKSNDAIKKLKEMGILRVEVDYGKSKLPEGHTTSDVPSEVPSSPVLSKTEALQMANTLYEEAITIQSTFLATLNNQAPADLTHTLELSESIIQAVFDNQDAMSCLTMIKNTDPYLLEHSINCAILMAMFTHHLGYDRDTIDDACIGALLMDVGMTHIPSELREKIATLNASDWSIIQSHVDIGIELVESSEQISDLTLAIIAQHHEREDGSGYPKGLSSAKISPFAKMAAIVDSYDAMISSRSHQSSITPTAALKRLTKDETLDQTLVAQFVQCVGVHPVGSLVKLKSGRLGIVSKQHPEQLASPVVITFYSINGRHFNEIKRIDLAVVDDEIEAGVKPDEFDINLPRFFREIFIKQMSAN